jgi:hypothetical protein
VIFATSDKCGSSSLMTHSLTFWTRVANKIFVRFHEKKNRLQPHPVNPIQFTCPHGVSLSKLSYHLVLCHAITLFHKNVFISCSPHPTYINTNIEYAHLYNLNTPQNSDNCRKPLHISHMCIFVLSLQLHNIFQVHTLTLYTVNFPCWYGMAPALLLMSLCLSAHDVSTHRTLHWNNR